MNFLGTKSEKYLEKCSDEIKSTNQTSFSTKSTTQNPMVKIWWLPLMVRSIFYSFPLRSFQQVKMKSSFVIACTNHVIIHPVEPFRCVHVLAFSILKPLFISDGLRFRDYQIRHLHRQHQLQPPPARFCLRHLFPADFSSKFNIIIFHFYHHITV